MTIKNRLEKLEAIATDPHNAGRTTQEDELLRARILARMEVIAANPEDNQAAAEHLQELMTQDN
ncbi:MAG: hypothetical protein Q7U74_16150 [Saprospiraceae bacterium]|nr:hypothetical protein [Saprospiraceae bacterium]